MTRGKRSSLAALTINAKHAEKSTTAATCAAIFCNSFIMIIQRRARNFVFFSIVDSQGIVKNNVILQQGGFGSAVKEKSMGLKEKTWIALFVLTVLLVIGATVFSYFPGDVAVTRFVQWITPASTGWANWISSTAKFPWNLVLLALTLGLSWRLARWRGALLAVASFAGMWVLGMWLGPLIGRPRPSADLVQVAEKLSGYSFPSIFGLTYASTLGFLAVLFARKTRGALRMAAVVVCFVLLVIGWAARISLGAHWPSDVLLSYLIGLLWADILIRFS